MKIERNRLTQALNIVAMTIENRNTIPILGHAAIVPGKDTVTVIGTDLDLEISVEIAAEEVSGEAITIPAPAKIARVLNLGGSTVTLGYAVTDKESKSIAIRSGRLDLEATHLPYEDFPRAPIGTQDALAEVRLSDSHLDTILRVSGAVSTEEVRYYLNGVFIHEQDVETTLDTSRFRAVATDGHRLYFAPIEVEGAAAFAKRMENMGASGRGMIVPRKVIDILRKLRKRIHGDLRMIMAPSAPRNRDTTLAPDGPGSRLIFAFETKDGLRVSLVTKLIDGTFPDYNRVIPTGDQDKRVEVNRSKLKQAVQLIGAMGGKGYRAVKLTFDPIGEGRLNVSAKFAAGIKSAGTWLEAETSVASPFEVGFNGTYLASICEASRGETLMIETSDAGAPASISSTEADGFRTVLMPMRI